MNKFKNEKNLIKDTAKRYIEKREVLSMLENFINTRAKAFTVFLFSVISQGILVISTQFAVMICSKWFGVIVGIIFMFLAMLLHLLAKKWSFFYIFSFLFNFIGCGFSVSAYYLTKELPINFFTLVIAAIPAGVILIFIYLMLQTFSKTKKATLSMVTILNFVLLVVAVIYWIKTDELFFSFGFFSLLIPLFFICVFGVAINHDERPVLRDISYGSFGAFVMLTVVVLVILSEGDVLEIGDLSIGRNKKKVKKR